MIIFYLAIAIMFLGAVLMTLPIIKEKYRKK